MTSIWQFELKITNLQLICMPVGAEVLHVDFQGERLYLWARVETNAPTEEREIEICGTGHPLHPGARHLGTLLDRRDALILHVFERAA